MGRKLTIALLLSLLPACSNSDVSPRPEAESAPHPRLGAEAAPRWKRLTKAPTARTEVVGAALGKRIFVIGGFARDDGTVGTVEVYKTTTDGWRRGPALPLAVNHAMAASLDGNVYVFGGYKGPGVDNPTNRAWVLRNGDWRAVARLPVRLGAGGAAAIGDRIFVTGGVKPGGLSERTYIFDPDDNSWRKRKGIPAARQHLGVAAADGVLHVVGGRTQGLDSNTARHDRYLPGANTWKKRAPMPTARGGLAAAATSNDFIVAAGGEGPDGTFDEAEALDARNGDWHKLPNMPVARHGVAVVAVGTRIYVIAGGPEPGLTYSRSIVSINLRSLR